MCQSCCWQLERCNVLLIQTLFEFKTPVLELVLESVSFSLKLKKTDYTFPTPCRWQQVSVCLFSRMTSSYEGTRLKLASMQRIQTMTSSRGRGLCCISPHLHRKNKLALRLESGKVWRPRSTFKRLLICDRSVTLIFVIRSVHSWCDSLSRSTNKTYFSGLFQEMKCRHTMTQWSPSLWCGGKTDQLPWRSYVTVYGSTMWGKTHTGSSYSSYMPCGTMLYLYFSVRVFQSL